MFAAAALPASAARPLLDSHQWDAYFALFARDAAVPWKRVTIRLDTYSGAPVEFAAYAVDPAEVIVAGANGRPRPLDTAHRAPAVRWKFTPPPGYQFASSDVEVPLQNREGFYVVEARRGDAVQQVWLNLTRIGLIAKESPGGILLYGTDLGSGQPLRGMRVSFLAGGRLVGAQTDKDGLVRWSGAGRPSFALAEFARSRAFVSLLPQSPLPAALVGVRLDRSLVRAGEKLRVAGFARARAGATYKPLAGEVKVSIVGRGRSLASESLRLDQAGAFAGEIGVPRDSAAGDFAVLATAGGATGGSQVHVDSVGDVVLTAGAVCGSTCGASEPIPLAIGARRESGGPAADTAVTVRIVRSPHILPPGESEDAQRWETTLLVERHLHTDANGIARLTIPAPSDGLSSTYGVSASTASTTATTRISTSTAPVALSIEPDQPLLDPGASAGFSVRAFDALDGKPAGGANVRVRLEHGPSVEQQTVRLDARGRGHVSFQNPQLGNDLAIAELEIDGKRALDATSVTVQPSALGASAAKRPNDMTVTLDRTRYKPGDQIGVVATLAGATGQALLTLEGGRPYEARTVAVSGGRAGGALPLRDVLGDVRVAVAMVRDGALYTSSVPLVIDGPGHPRATLLTADKGVYGPGQTARITIHDGDLPGGATLVARLADGRSSPGAAFDDAPAILATGGTTSQDPSSPEPSWHAWVAPARSKAGDIFAYERPRGVAHPDLALGAAAPKAVLWRVTRHEGTDTLDVPLPVEKGRYILSIMKIADDGDVGAASISLTVQ